MAVLYKNNAASTLASGINTTATSIVLASGGGAKFPAVTGSDFFYLTILDGGGNFEIVKVTVRTVDTLTVVRAQEGTTALTFASGVICELRITGGLLDQFKSDTATSITSSNVTNALGFTPYNASNPSGYITSSALSGYLTSASAASTYLPLAGGTLTGQYLDFSQSTVSLRITTGPGRFNIGDDDSVVLASAFRFYTGGTDGSTLYGDFRTNPATGNSIISAKTGALFFNYDHGTGGVVFSNGAQGTVGTVDSSGNANFSGAITQASNQVLHAGNFGSYALPLTGGTVSGVVRINNQLQVGQNTNGTATIDAYGGYAWFGRDSNSTGIRIDASGNVNVTGALTQGGNQVLHAGNYNSYAPTLTGGGASGTWGISISGNAATATNSSQLGGISSDRAILKRRGRIHPADSTSLNTSISAPEMGFSYGGSGEPAGPYIAFGGLGGNIDYSCQLAGAYSGGGNDFKIRTRNDDAAIWNAWRTILTDGNYNSYAPTLTGTGASGTWNISISGNAATATTLTSTQSNWGSTGVLSNVVGLLSWRNYGTSHVIFDASAGLSPSGSSVNNTNSQIAWAATYPTLMGWNGANTYGVRVDSARVADSATSAPNYLPLTGGTLSGALTINAGGGYPIQTTSSTRYLVWLKNTSASAQTQGWWLAHDVGGNLVVHADSNGDKVSIASSGFGFQVGVASTYDNPGGWGANLVASGTYHARVRLKATSYNSSGDRETYMWLDNTVSPATGIYSTAPTFAFGGSIGTVQIAGSTVLHAGNYTSYVNPKGGGWYGSGLPGTRWGGYSTSGGEISFGDGLPNAAQMGILVDGCYVAGENNGFWSMGSDNTWGSRRGMYWDGTYLNFTTNSATASFTNALIGGNQIFHAGNYTGYNGIVRALGYPSASTDWNSLGNGYQNSIIQVDPSNFASTASGPTAASYTYGMLLNFAAMSSSQAQIYISHAGNDLIFRGGWNGNSWQTWNKVLTNQNYTSYAVPQSDVAQNGANKVLKTASNGYLYIQNWIDVAGNGIFSTTTNGSHFLPNPDSYGSWKVLGTRNGWNGLEFGSLSTGAVTLMVHTSSNITGFHNNNYGWQFRWEGGTLYCSKNTYGAGTDAIVLDAANYNNYAPTKTGGGASGTWGINVTGTAGSISGYNNPTTAATANTIAYRDGAGDLTVRELVLNVGVQDFTPSSLVAIYPTTNQAVKVTAGGARNFLDVPTRGGGNASGTWGISVTGSASSSNSVNSTGLGSGNYTWYQTPGGLQQYTGSWASFLISNHGDGATYYNQTIIMPFWDAPMYMRKEGGTNRGPWYFITAENYTSYVPTLTGTGASGSWNITAARATRANGNLYIDDNYGNGVVGVYASTRYQGVFFMGDSYKMSADGTSLANMYGIGWSHPNAGGAAGNLTDHGMLIINNGGFRCAISNSIVASGNITAYSDERLKTNWRDMPEDYVTRLAEVKVGIYDRIDEKEMSQVGVSAQSLQRLLPQAIMTAKDEMQTLSVSYGNAALASSVELAKEVVDLRTRVAQLEFLINQLIGD